jgi:hypothetical protein
MIGLTRHILVAALDKDTEQSFIKYLEYIILK